MGELPTHINQQPKKTGWLVLILPYVDQDSIYNNFSQNNWDPTKGGVEPIRLYYCPSEPQAFPILIPGHNNDCGTDYVAVAGWDYNDGKGIINTQKTIKMVNITDGASRTVMVGERPPIPSTTWGRYSAYAEGSISGAKLMTTLVYQDNLGNPCPPPPYYFGSGPLSVTNPCSVNYMWSNHPGGANFILGDGSVRFITYSAALIMPALTTYNGGESVQIP